MMTEQIGVVLKSEESLKFATTSSPCSAIGCERERESQPFSSQLKVMSHSLPRRGFQKLMPELKDCPLE